MAVLDTSVVLFTAMGACALASGCGGDATTSGTAQGGAAGAGAAGGGGTGAGDCVMDEGWTAMPTAGAPSPRYEFAWVWTGSELIVWGGHDAADQPLSDGARFDPASMTWSPLASVGAPAPRRAAIAAWTGTEMLVWGGRDVAPLNSGGRYDPATNSWQPMSTAEGPSARRDASGAWTGTHLVVWGGIDYSANLALNTGAAYDPRLDQWTATTVTGAPAARIAALSGAVDGVAYFLGGCCDAPDEIFANGGGYDPATDSWSPVPAHSVLQRDFVRIAESGARLVVWGGFDYQSDDYALFDGAIYDPALATWTPLAASGAPTAAYPGVAADDSALFVVGCTHEPGDTCLANVAGRYDFASDAWTSAPPCDVLGVVRSFTRYHAATTKTAQGALVWSGARDLQIPNQGAIWLP